MEEGGGRECEHGRRVEEIHKEEEGSAEGEKVKGEDVRGEKRGGGDRDVSGYSRTASGLGVLKGGMSENAGFEAGSSGRVQGIE